MTTTSIKKGSIAAVAIVSVALALLLARSFVGVGVWGDEPFGLSTTLRYVLGDRPLVDSWDTNFSSAIVAMPFVHAYLALVGSTEGILLAFRFVWLALVVVTSATAYLVLRDVMKQWLAFVVAVLLLLYFPYLSPYVGYGADWSWHMLAVLAAVQLWRHPPKHAIWHAVPGVLTALGIIGNPPTITVVPFFVAALWIAHGSHRWPAIGYYLLGGGVVGAAFAGVVLALAGPRVWASLPYLSSPDDHDFSLGAQVARLLGGKYIVGVPLVVGLALGLAMRLKRNVRTEGAWFLALASTLAIDLALVATRRIPPLHAPQVLVFSVAATLLIMQLVAGRTRFTGGQALLVIPSLGAAIGWFLGSNGGLATAVLASPMLLAAALTSWPDESGQKASPALLGAKIALVALVIAVAAIGLLFTPEGATPTMTRPMASGPFTGIFTTPAEAERLTAIQDDLAGLSWTPRTVFLERFPLGYLLEGTRPGTYSTWATSATSDRLQTYVDVTGNAPTRIVLTRFRADLDDGEFPASVSLRGIERYREVFASDEIRVLQSSDDGILVPRQ